MRLRIRETQYTQGVDKRGSTVLTVKKKICIYVYTLCILITTYRDSAGSTRSHCFHLESQFSICP